MAQAARHLQLVDADTGEIVESRELAELQVELDDLKKKFRMAQRDVAAKNLRIANLEADHARRRLEHPHYQDAVRVARYWWRKCRASNARVHFLSPDRLDAVLALMDMEELVEVPGRKRRVRQPRYSMVDFKMAIDGAAFDHFVSQRKNGTEQHFDDLELVCRSVAKFQEFIDRCPYPREVAESALARDNAQRVPTTLPDPGGIGKEGSYGQAGVLGGQARWLVVREQGGGLLVRGRVEVGVAGEPAAV